MKRISYCGESFLTTNDTADALLELIVAFPAGHDSELLEVPAVNSDGAEIVVHVVVGPGSELISIPEAYTAVEPDTMKAVANLRGRILALTAHRDVTYAEAVSLAEYGWDWQDAL